MHTLKKTLTHAEPPGYPQLIVETLRQIQSQTDVQMAELAYEECRLHRERPPAMTNYGG